MGDLDSTSTPGMWELDRAKKKDNPLKRKRGKKSRKRVHITDPMWIMASFRYFHAKALWLSVER